MFEEIGNFIVTIADFLCGYPLFFLLIGGGLYLFIASGAVSLRRLPVSVRELRHKSSNKDTGQISSAQALLSAVAGTVGLGNIAGVAIALVVGGPGAIFWMWVSALVGMCTKYHEGALTIMYKGSDPDGNPRGGIMYIIEKAFGPRWKPLAVFFAVSGMFGTLCIINANQLTEAVISTFTTPDGLADNAFLDNMGFITGLGAEGSFRLIFGMAIALIVALVVLRGVTRIARVATILVPFMVGIYFLMVAYIIATNIHAVPEVFNRIFSEAFNLQAGFGAFAGIAIIGARRAALVNDAGIGTASIMHGASRNTEPVREGLVAMLGPALDSGLVCTLTAVALLLCADFSNVQGVEGLSIAMDAFNRAIPGGAYMLMLVVFCFSLSSMFSYSYYGTSCATYLFGARKARFYTWGFILTLVVFAIIPVGVAVGLTDLFYAFMAIPAMTTILVLSGRVRKATRNYFSKDKKKSPNPDNRTTQQS